MRGVWEGFEDVRERERKEWTGYKDGNRTIMEMTYKKEEERKKSSF